jgi:hypothetical protein
MQIFSVYIIYFISSQHVSSILKIHSFLFSSCYFHHTRSCSASYLLFISFLSARVNLKLIKKNFQQPDQERPLHFYERSFMRNIFSSTGEIPCSAFIFQYISLCWYFKKAQEIVIKTFSSSLFSFILMVFRMKMLKYTLLLSAACTYI